MPEKREEKEEVLNQVKVYPFSEANDPKPRKVITPDGRPWMEAAPVGTRYWELLADTINREPVQERDGFFMAILKSLGIEKGKPFNPNWRQQRILTEAAIVGEAMVLNMVEKGSKYTFAYKDGEGHYLSGGLSYKLHLPKNVPAANFLSITLYDAENASGLQNGQSFPSIGSLDHLQYNDDGSGLCFSVRSFQLVRQNLTTFGLRRQRMVHVAPPL